MTGLLTEKTVVAALLLLNSTVLDPIYRTYHNARYGYRIDYPADLKPQPEAPNGDGRRFVSADGKTTLAAYAGYNALDGGVAEDRRLARQEWQERKATLTLDQLTRTGYVLSGTIQNAIFYQKTVLKGNTLTTFIWQYPANRKAAMNAVIQHTLSTLDPATE